MNLYNKQEYSMNLCNLQHFLKLSIVNKYLPRIFFEFLEQETSYSMNF
jgi:hypothetical protein